MFSQLPPLAQIALAIGLILLSRSKKFYDLMAQKHGDQRAIKLMKFTKVTGIVLLVISVFVNSLAILFLFGK